MNLAKLAQLTNVSVSTVSKAFSDINLSCIKMHLDEVCDTALDLLYQKIEGNQNTAKRSVSIIREFSLGESLL